MKVAIMINEETAERCTGKGCLKAFFGKKDSFEGYPEDAELIAFFHIGGDLNKKIQRLIDSEVDTVHLSSCLRSKYEDYDSLALRLSEHFNVVGYTHGKEEGKTRKAVRYSRISSGEPAELIEQKLRNEMDNRQ